MLRLTDTWSLQRARFLEVYLQPGTINLWDTFCGLPASAIKFVLFRQREEWSRIELKVTRFFPIIIIIIIILSGGGGAEGPGLFCYFVSSRSVRVVFPFFSSLFLLGFTGARVRWANARSGHIYVCVLCCAVLPSVLYVTCKEEVQRGEVVAPFYLFL